MIGGMILSNDSYISMKCLQRIKIQEMNIRYLKIAHTMLCVRKIFQKKGLHGVVKLLPRIDRRAERLLGSLYDSNDDECYYNHVGSIRSCEADRRYGIYEGALAGAEHPNRKRIPEEVVSTPPRVVNLDGQFSDREEFTHSAIRFVVKANNQASELSPSQPVHTLNVNGTVSPCCPTDAGQKQLVFTCPFTDCGKRVSLLLGVNDIHDHYLREIPECTHPLIHELKHWTMDNGCILHENCTRFNATKVKCPARHCRALFTTPARWVKHVIRKHPNCIS